MSEQPPRLELNLAYAHGDGDLAPYFEALVIGKALAGRCTACGKVWFPPHINCPDDGNPCEWCELDGTGVIVSATETRSRLPFATTVEDHVFVLVAMNGADNAAFGRLVPASAGAGVVGRDVRLATGSGTVPHPAQAAVFEFLEKK